VLTDTRIGFTAHEDVSQSSIMLVKLHDN
jgi:hypothetical protein